MRQFRLLYCFICLMLCCNSVNAKIKLPAIIGSNMVLQQQGNVKLWGQATANTKIKITTSWDDKNYQTRSNAQGKWNVEIQTPVAGGPYQITISDGDEPCIIENVLIGEVWLCSGQSNMEMPVKGYRGQPVVNSHQTIVTAQPKREIRMFTVERGYNTLPQDTLQGKWVVNSPKNVADFSATGYYFGDMLQTALDVPVGLIHSSWSASKIEAWMDQETLSQFPEITLPDVNQKEFGYTAGTPTLLYNAMINPLKGLTVKGVVWYQGESNSANPALYKRLFPAWITQWRNFFNDAELPIYYVQIAPHQSMCSDSINLPLFREAQLESMRAIPHVGMAFSTDAGSEKFIHAPYKKRIGERLAFWAMAKTYGIEGISYCGPIYASHQRKGSKVELTFDYGADGLTPENENVEGFEIAGSDGLFLPAEARIINGSARVEVWNDSVAQPQEVRYCFRNYKEGSLANNVALPAAPFRVVIDSSTQNAK